MNQLHEQLRRDLNISIIKFHYLLTNYDKKESKLSLFLNIGSLSME